MVARPKSKLDSTGLHCPEGLGRLSGVKAGEDARIQLTQGARAGHTVGQHVRPRSGLGPVFFRVAGRKMGAMPQSAKEMVVRSVNATFPLSSGHPGGQRSKENGRRFRSVKQLLVGLFAWMHLPGRPLPHG